MKYEHFKVTIVSVSGKYRMAKLKHLPMHTGYTETPSDLKNPKKISCLNRVHFQKVVLITHCDRIVSTFKKSYTPWNCTLSKKR